MTEKRFKLFVGNNYGVQKVDGEVIFDSIISMAEADVLVDLLNDLTEKNEQLKHDATVLIQANQDYRGENEQLKTQLVSINRLIDNKIDEFRNGDYGDLPCSTIHMFLDLKQELGDLE